MNAFCVLSHGIVNPGPVSHPLNSIEVESRGEDEGRFCLDLRPHVLQWSALARSSLCVPLILAPCLAVLVAPLSVAPVAASCSVALAAVVASYSFESWSSPAC